ncbi:copper resistance protein B [Novosphingobium sediminis]|jgi:copper resistance protein B|nr:copper resistance protein B [Novosphingobium sediminis]
MSIMLALLALVSASPVVAQHQGHTMPAPAPAPAPTPDPASVNADPHTGHDMSQDAPLRGDDPHAGHDMRRPADDPAATGMDSMQGMDHSTMGHDTGSDASSLSPGPDMETPPPPEAGSGPPRAADAFWGAKAMAASREDLRRSHGDFPVFWFQGDRFETQVRDAKDAYLWDIQGYYGGPTERLWFKSEGEGEWGLSPDDAEVQALYSKAIAPFWDVQAGVRQDIAGPDTTHVVLGIQGLAAYRFEVDAAMFLSHRGDLTARIEAELDQRITQRLILQPRIEANLSAQDIPLLGIGAGLDRIEVGARLRYEVRREFAPYIGVDQSWRIGNGADFARARGQASSGTSFVAGIRFWF